MFRVVLKELKNHVPHTVVGLVSGIVFMFIFYRLPQKVAFNIFYILHPLHVVFSAMTTAALYKIYKKGKNFNIWVMYLVGYTGVIVVATISDSMIPYLGEILLGLPNRGIHIGFIERWYLVNPLALLGVTFAYFVTRSKCPHSIHVFLSTWASLFHMIMALGGSIDVVSIIIISIFLFIAVWIPACGSDIVYPMLFVRESEFVDNDKKIEG